MCSTFKSKDSHELRVHAHLARRRVSIVRIKKSSKYPKKTVTFQTTNRLP